MGTLVLLEGRPSKSNEIFLQPFILTAWSVKERHEDKL
jgi:hypothetical protein